MTSSTQILESGIALLRLEQPGRLNALSLSAMQAVCAQLEALLAEPSLRVLIVTGQGAAFCAGLDLNSVLNAEAGFDASVREAMALQHAFAGLVQRLRASDAAVIAAVNGPAVGAGMGLALAADIRFAAPQAQFHVGAVKIGLTAGECGISYHLPRLIGAGRAFEIMLSGRAVHAEEAERTGLVAEIVAGEGLLERALVCARQICANAPYATAHTKRVMWQNLDAAGLLPAIELENHAQVLGLMTRDFQEAAQAFTQKRPAQFTGK